jgi:hypothetical protein
MEEMTEPDKQLTLKKRKRRKTAALGAGILFFAAVGVCLVLFYIIKSAVTYVSDFVAGPNETESFYENYLAPAVMFDPDTFTDSSKSDPQWRLETAIWAALYENETNGTYASTSDGREILPIKDVTAYLKKYYGNTENTQYVTFTRGDFTYEYNQKEQCYYIPLTAISDYYYPKVTKISKGFNTVTLSVAYFQGKNWGQDTADSDNQQADKYVTVILSGNHGNYKLKSIQNDEQAKTAISSGILTETN